jgi:hypothetical protein
LWVLVAGLVPAGLAQSPAYRPPPRYVANGKADQAEGARILGEFHQAGIVGTYWLAFELEVMPRHGADRTLKGELFGTGGDGGPLTRLSVDGQAWLIQGGPAPASWTVREGTAVHRLTAGETLQPVAGTDLTIFDLQMPFLHWADFVYEGLARVRGRPTHSFVVYPPADLGAARPDLTGVRMLIDTQFQQLVQAELLGEKGASRKTITILDLKKVGEQWVPKSIDLRNSVTRDKTRLTFTATALGLDLPAGTFAAGQLGAAPPAVPPEKVVRF